LEMNRIDPTFGSACELGAAGFETIFSHPSEVLADRKMNVESKRALLASWASDARAVEHAPMLRQIDSGAVVKLDDVLSALRRLDADPGGTLRVVSGAGKRRRTPTLRLFSRQATRPEDPDDPHDPPPAAAIRQIALEAA
jgi:hypothetical protein